MGTDFEAFNSNTNLSARDCINQLCERYNKSRNPGPIIAKILSAAQGSNDLQSCLSAIENLTEYLSDDNEFVRNIAAVVIVLLVVKATNFLSKETDPNKIQKVSEFLLKVIEKLTELNNNGKISLNSDSQVSLKQSIKEILKLLVKSALPKNDEFVSHKENPEADLLRNKFINSLDKTRRSILLGTGGDQFISSNNQQ